MEVSSPLCCSKQGHLEQIIKYHFKSGFNTPKDGDSTTSLGNLLQCFITLLKKKKKKSCLNGTSTLICPLCLLFLYWIPLRRVWTHLAFIHFDIIPTEPFLLGLNNPRCLTISSYVRLSCALITLVTLSGKFSVLTMIHPYHSFTGNPDLDKEWGHSS